MMYSSKQKLAMAMAATMVMSMAPAMSFAAQADVDAVVKALGDEKVDLVKAAPFDVSSDAKSAEKVLAVAKGFVKGDPNAQLIVDAYQASIDVFKVTTNKKDCQDKIDAYKAAIAKLTFMDISGSFNNAQTHANHAAKLASLPDAPIPGAVSFANVVLTKAAIPPNAFTITGEVKGAADPAKCTVKVLGLGDAEKAQIAVGADGKFTVDVQFDALDVAVGEGKLVVEDDKAQKLAEEKISLK